MFDINKTGKTWEVRFSEDEASPELLSALFAKAEIENVLKDSKLTKEQADELANEVKASYWEANKDWILKKINKDELFKH